MNRAWSLILVGAALAILPSVGPSAWALEPAEPAVMTPKDVPHPDLELVASSKGWTLEQAVAQDHAADVVGTIATRIAAERPEIFVGSALSTTPGGAPTLYVKRAADSYVRDLLAASDIDLKLADMQPYSFDELEARKLNVHRSLEAAGFRNIATRVNIGGGGVIPVAVAVEPGLPTAATKILAYVSQDVRSSVQLTVTDSSGFRDTTSFGGMWVTKDGNNNATPSASVNSNDHLLFIWFPRIILLPRSGI